MRLLARNQAKWAGDGTDNRNIGPGGTAGTSGRDSEDCPDQIPELGLICKLKLDLPN